MQGPLFALPACRNCGKKYHTQGIKNHEKKCLPVWTPREDTQPDSLVTSSSHPTIEQSARFEFPKMLYKMLEDCTFDERYCHIVSWQPHGLAFKVHNRNELEKILSRWFREKYESFRCLLEQWGFLKLARGKDRGCWYHKKFYYHQDSSNHSKTNYEKVNKDDFIEAMPEYLSFRDEPDLEKESTKDNRVPLTKRKRVLDEFPDKDSNWGAVSDKVKTTLQRHRPSTLKKCQYCNQIFVAQGFRAHVKYCRMSAESADRMAKKRKAMDDESDSSDNYDDESDRNSLSERRLNKSPEPETSRGDRLPCMYCGDLFSKFGLKTHEKHCKVYHDEQRDSLRAGINNKNAKAKVNENQNDNDKETNRKGSVPSDDSSVDSIESGCRICGFDDDHANLLLCEGCDTEVHTYCLTPPLEKVPTGDWFCDSCKLRMGKAEEEFGSLFRNVPPEMSERFGEICFAKSAENAHWWPALIFDPRSFLHNREVVDLARKNLGKRYLVFFFENQDAFAAIPKKWIMTWDQALEKEFDKGRSVRKASKSRKEQFERAMKLANGANEEGSSHDSESDDMEFDSQSDSESSSSPRIPRVIGVEPTIFDLRPDFDWKPIRNEVRREVEAASPSKYTEMVEDEINVTLRASGKSQAQMFMSGRHLYIGLFSDQLKAALAVKLFQEKMKTAMDTLSKTTKKKPRRKKRIVVSTPDVVGSSPTTEVGFGTFTDKKPMGWRSRSVEKANRETYNNTEIDHTLQSPQRKAPPQPDGMNKEQEKKEVPEKIATPPPPPLSDRERNELLLKTSLSQYYLLPLSQL